MPLSVYKFTSSFFGKVLTLASIIYLAYYNIAYSLVLTALFIFISEVGYLEGFTNVDGLANVDGLTKASKPIIPNVKDAFIKEHCTDKKTTFNLETIEEDYTGLVFTDGVCNPCDKTCRYTINNTSEQLYLFDTKIKPKDSTDGKAN